MKLDKLVGERFKERPSDCAIDSHALMIRGGYMKYVANGIFSQYMPLRRVCRKIEQIIREEMDAIDGQEVLFPVVLPASLWEESGRYTSVGSELLRMSDRNGSKLVLGMTHEEACVQLVREYGQTYTKYPFMVYQIQTKFRDEARPRGGLIRVREFTMKDAYSFHTSQEDLEKYYARCYDAYKRIFARAGIPEVVVVASDSGMMGGSISHEYMLLTPVGEDSIAICTDCGFSANVDAAENILEKKEGIEQRPLEKVYTPNIHTIEEICEFLHTPLDESCKAVVYQKADSGEYIAVFVRGDLEVNETKLTSYLGCEIVPAQITEDCPLKSGYIGPYNLPEGIIAVYDRSLLTCESMSCGANEEEYHYVGLCAQRDLKGVEYHDVSKIKTGGICPKCGKKAIEISRGIEVGNIFQLGTKYTKSMNMQYLDSNGEAQYPIMGCYGIGVGRLAASVCEAKHDDYGVIWPMSIAPWQVHLCLVRADDEEARAYADKLYNDLQKEGIEVIYDDRNVRAGVMFSDADLLGVPVRVVVSPRNMKQGCCEISLRDKSLQTTAALDEAVSVIKNIVTQKLDEIKKSADSVVEK